MDKYMSGSESMATVRAGGVIPGTGAEAIRIVSVEGMASDELKAS